MRRITQWRPHNLYDSMLFKDLSAGENVKCAIRLKRAPAMRALPPPSFEVTRDAALFLY